GRRRAPRRSESGGARSVTQLEHHENAALGARVDDLLTDLAQKRRRPLHATRDDRQILLAVHSVGDRALEYAGADVELPQDVAGLGVDALEGTVRVAVEDQAARSGHGAAEEWQVLLDAPDSRLLHRIPGLELREVPARAGLVEVELGGEVELARCVVLRLARDIHAQVEGRDVDQPGLPTVGHRLPVLTAEEVRAHVPRPSVQPGALFRVLDRTA